MLFPSSELDGLTFGELDVILTPHSLFLPAPRNHHSTFCLTMMGVPGWLSQLVLILAQVMISWFVGLSPVLDCALTVQGLLGILPLSLSFCLAPARALSQE